jgi:hypothetical protein
VLLGTPDEESNSGSLIGSSALQRGNQTSNMTQGLEVMNPQPMMYPMIQLMFFHYFRCVLGWFQNVGSRDMSNGGVDRLIRHKDYTLVSVFNKTMSI